MRLLDEYQHYISNKQTLPGAEELHDRAKRIVFDILEDLTDRNGLRHEFEACEDDIKEEILQRWVELTITHL